MCCTSPPYWGLRDYGIDNQLGLEPTPEEYVANLVAVFRDVRRVLRDDGVVWLNLGDSYSSSIKGGGGPDSTSTLHGSPAEVNGQRFAARRVDTGLKPKDLVGIPWRVAFALQADGWWLRSDVIWAKPNPMPESVTDRPTKSHEYVFLLSKKERYFYDADAIKEASVCTWNAARSTLAANGFKNVELKKLGQRRTAGADTYHRDEDRTGRNRRTVWTVAAEPYAEAHFAVMPTQLVEPCVLAGSKRGDTVLDPFAGRGHGRRGGTPARAELHRHRA